VKTTVYHDAQLIGDSLWHVQPMELIVQKCRQTMVELPCVTDHTCGRIEHSLKLVSNRLRRPCIECIAVVDARRNIKLPSLASPILSEIFLPKLDRSWRADVLKTPRVSWRSAQRCTGHQEQRTSLPCRKRQALPPNLTLGRPQLLLLF